MTVFEFILLKRYSWFSKCLEFFCALRCYSVGVLRCQGVRCFGVNSVSKGSGFEGVTNPNPVNIRRSVISIKVVGLVMTASHFVVDVTLLLVVAFKKPTGARKGDQSSACSVFTTTTFCHMCVRMRWRQLTGCTERSHMLTTAGFHFQCNATHRTIRASSNPAHVSEACGRKMVNGRAPP